MHSLPRIMVAPNGGRRTKTDHPALPITIAETVAAAKACHAAGAGMLHAHVRDSTGGHSLDAGLYSELIAEMSRAVPDMPVQITTEGRGRYGPEEQRDVIRAVQPVAASIGLGEMISDGDLDSAGAFYAWAQEAGIAVQHILYSAEDLDQFLNLRRDKVIPGGPAQLLFVLGRYSTDQESRPEELAPFLEGLASHDAGHEPDWALCAFGRMETACLVEAARHGGKARVGFENSLFNADGSRAADNAERVAEVKAALDDLK